MKSIGNTTILLFTLALGILLAGCTRRSSDEDESGRIATPSVPVKTARVILGTAVTSITATGHTDLLRKEKVLAPVTGTVVAFKAFEGARFHKGEIMAVIRPKEAQAAIRGARSLLRGATTPAQEAEARRMLELAESGNTSVDVRAAFNGTIAARSTSEGEVVAENTELFTLVDLSSLIFVADLPLSALSEVRNGFAADIRLNALPGTIVRGVVEAISPQGDSQSQTVKIRLRITTRGNAPLKSDMAGTARIITGEHDNALLVPRAALLRNDETNAYSVVAVTNDSLAHTIMVNIGALTDSTAEVTGGSLQQDMRVVVEGNYALADSTKVVYEDF